MRLDEVLLNQKDSMESTDVEEKMCALAEFQPSGTAGTEMWVCLLISAVRKHTHLLV